MKLRGLTAIALAMGLLTAGAAYAQQQAPAGAPDLNAIPPQMPFNLPFGTPISLDKGPGPGSGCDCRGQQERLARGLRGGSERVSPAWKTRRF